MARELERNTQIQIDALCEEGNRLQESGDFKGAWNTFVEALELVPEPKRDWEAATWIIAALGDVAFSGRKYEEALEAFSDAVRCPGGLGNVFIHLRKGQCHLELGDEKRAADDLTRAYMGGGREVFEKEDPKYFKLLERLLKPPKGQDRL